MDIKVLKEREIYNEIAKDIIDLINDKHDCVLGLATGSTPLGIYKNLQESYLKGEVSFKDVRTFNLDEYVGLKNEHPQSYYMFMRNNLFDKIDINLNNVHFPSGKTNEELQNYDLEIEKNGGIDFQILGIGSNGHIAFNEPGTPFSSMTHFVKLKDSTRIDNSRFFNSIDEVPTHAITMGLQTIMKAKRIVLIALGENKSEAIFRLFNETQNEDLPASILLSHPNVTIYCDENASKKIVGKRR